MEKIKLKTRQKIEYNGEMLTITTIAKKEGILSIPMLKKMYEETGDIYESVKVLKSRQTGQRKKIEYHGQMHTINSIAKLEGIRWLTLKRYYEEFGDIEKAVAATKEGQRLKSGTIEYHGEMKTLNAIAKSEGLNRNFLKKYYDQYGNIEKAIMIAKRHQRKKHVSLTTVKINDKMIDLHSAAIILGIDYSELLNKLSDGISINEIKKSEHKKPGKRKRENRIVLENGQTLRDYCFENGINYRAIYYSMTTYGRSFEDAIENYKNNGQKFPKTWIFNRYGVLLRHFLLEEHLQINRIVRFMREENITIEEALTKYIIRRNAKQANLDQDWLEELYGVFTDENMTDEYDDFKKGFYVDEEEETCIIKSLDDIQRLQRKRDLFEIEQSLRGGIFTEEEEAELLRQYNITPEEIEFMFIDLYSRFEHGVLRGENQEEQIRINTINDIIRRWESLTKEEKNEAIKANNITREEFERIQNISAQIKKYKTIIEMNRKPTELDKKLDDDLER